MNPLDDDLATLFARDEPDEDGDAFRAAVRKRITARRRWTRALELALVAMGALAVAALVALVPDTVLYPVVVVQRFMTSPLGAGAGVLAAIALAWWTRFGET